MTLHDHTQRVVLPLPIRTHPGEVFNHDDIARYDVTKAIELIIGNPELFQQGSVPLSALSDQMRRRGKYNFHIIASMPHSDARRPVLIGRLEDGTERLLDGYHRASRSLQLGYADVAAWILTPEQTEAVRLPQAPQG